MKNYNLILLLSLISMLNVACEKEDKFVPEVQFSIESDLFASGELRETGEDDFAPFYIGIGDTNTEIGHIFWQSGFSEGQLGSTLIIGVYPTELITTTPLFGLQFWSDQFPTDQDWTAGEMSDFFAPGTTFEFGQGPDKVELSLLLPIGGPYAPGPSRSSYLVDPVGSLTVTSIEDFNYPIATRPGESRYGMIIRATFSGQIGRYDSLADQADGNPNVFITDEVVELQNGEVAFYVNYEQE
jgi:hypothetical protein